MKEILLVWGILNLSTVLSITSTGHSVMTYVNFEKCYQIEEELITLADLILKQEKIMHDGEDVHDIRNMTKFVEDTKKIHKDIGFYTQNYLQHPVNNFHLVKRLSLHWKNIVERLLESSSCVKNLKVKLQNLEDSIPSREEFNIVAHSMNALNFYGRFSLADLKDCSIGGHKPKKGLSLSDMSDIGFGAFANEDYFAAYQWLKYVFESMKSAKLKQLEEGSSISYQGNLLASVYFKMGFIDQAKAVLTELLKIDPENKSAKRNMEYYKRLSIKPKTGSPVRKRPTLKSHKYYEDFCSSGISRMESRSTRLHCMYFPYRGLVPYMKSDIKAEMLSRKPLIVMFYDVINNDTAKAISYIGYQAMSSKPRLQSNNAGFQSVAVYDKTPWRWVPNLQRLIFDIKISNFNPRWQPFVVTEVGMDGYTAVNRTTYTVQPVGTYLSFLSDSTRGGEVVFPLSKLKIPVSKGDMLFYDYHAKMMICPVLYGSQWYGVQSLYENIKQKITVKTRRTTI